MQLAHIQMTFPCVLNSLTFIYLFSIYPFPFSYIHPAYEPTCTPPLGCKLCPEIKLLSGPAKNTKQVATSLGCPGLPIGHVNCSCASLLIVAGISGVQIGPGQTQVTRIPLLSCWFERAYVKATMAPLLDV